MFVSFAIHKAQYNMFWIAAYAEFLKANGEKPVFWKRAASMDEVLREADVVGLHTEYLMFLH